MQDGTVTAGTSSGINDGAAALAVASAGDGRESWARSRMARVVSTAVAGVDPSCMGLGPVPATRKALDPRRASRAAQLDLVELNEAFAAQAIACIRELELDPAEVNIYGGGDRAGAPARRERGPHPHDAGARAPAHGRALRSGDDVHRGGTGDRDGGRDSESGQEQPD